MKAKELAIRGEVLDGSIDNETLTFTLHGLNEQIIIILVAHQFPMDSMIIEQSMPKVFWFMMVRNTYLKQTS